MEEVAIPPNSADIQLGFWSKLKESNTLVVHCTSAPTVKAIATDSNIPTTISEALEVFI